MEVGCETFIWKFNMKIYETLDSFPEKYFEELARLIRFI